MRKGFKCKSEAQKRAIRRNYAIRAKKYKVSKKHNLINKDNTNKFAKLIVPSGWTKEDVSGRSKVYNLIKDSADVELVHTGYGYKEYRVKEKNNVKLTKDQKALIADQGNLCFGYTYDSTKDTFKIYTD